MFISHYLTAEPVVRAVALVAALVAVGAFVDLTRTIVERTLGPIGLTVRVAKKASRS